MDQRKSKGGEDGGAQWSGLPARGAGAQSRGSGERRRGEGRGGAGVCDDGLWGDADAERWYH
jgi:hypothetical protein